MYSDKERPSFRRSDDEFLRRLRGGEFGGGRISLPNSGVVPVASVGENNLPTEPGEVHDEDYPYLSGALGTACKMPSLAMVYSPSQEWRDILEPETGLEQGTIFRELIKPWTVGMKNGGTEVNTRR